ncbi:MAG TPA: HTH-type transcriptional regulator HdfR [Pseudomonadales bacterium]|nr:HTH-type transcriptional regulator HdfR [Pseudomonadales bacterium]
MDTELLKTFMEVSRTRHFGRAAENLYLTQSAVSFRIRQLEGLLGVELFSRQRNNIQLTAAGEKLMPLAETSVRLEQRIRQEIATVDGQSQQFTLGATPNLWDALLQSRLNSILGSLEKVNLTAWSHSSSTLARQILERSLDLAFTFDAPKVDDLTTVEVSELPLYLVASRHFEDWQQAIESNYVLVDWGSAFVSQHAQQVKTQQVPLLQTNTGRIALDCILANQGAAYMPLSLVEPYLGKELYLIEDAPVLTRTVFASFHAASGREELIYKIISQLSL